MNLSGLDWIIISLVIGGLIAVAAFVRKSMSDVAGFLAANRCAGRYLLCISTGMASMSAVSVIMMMQAFYEVGLVNNWWGALTAPLMTILAISGWVVYRFRETRALTMAQFFEIRYSRNLRVFAGVVAFLAGIINYGVFPAIGTLFFIHYGGLPEQIGIFSTFHLIMILLLGISVFLTLSGGQINVIVTDFLQGMFANFVFVVIMLVILKSYGISSILDGLEIAPEGKSMLNPVDIQDNRGFNLWYFFISYVITVYSYKIWQGEQGYNSSATTPHEAKMAGIIGPFRWTAFLGSITLIPLCAYTIMHHPDYADKAELIQSILSNIKNPEIRSQMITPVAMKTFIPPGLMGCFAAAMLAAFISSHDTQLHSWASILVQDIILPFRKEPLSTQTHLLFLRLSVVLVAVLVFTFSCLFKQTQHFQIYAMVSGAVYIGGAGIVVIGGLYWKRGTTAGAWASMISGAIVSISAILIEQYWVYIYDKSFPIDFKWWSMIAIGVSVFFYLLFSFLSNKEFDMDRMLHRGKYSIAKDHDFKQQNKYKGWLKILGMTDEFTGTDKFLWWLSLIVPIIFCFYVIIVTLIYLKVNFSDHLWRKLQSFWLYWSLLCFPPTFIWLTIGGFSDLISFFRVLKKVKRNALDDGMVVDHHNLADEIADEQK